MQAKRETPYHDPRITLPKHQLYTLSWTMLLVIISQRRVHLRRRTLQLARKHLPEAPLFRKRKITPHKRFSKMIFLNAKNSESALLAEPHGAVMFSCRTLTFSAKVSCRTLEIAEPKALNLEKDNLAEPWNAGSFRVCPLMRTPLSENPLLGPLLRTPFWDPFWEPFFPLNSVQNTFYEPSWETSAKPLWEPPSRNPSWKRVLSYDLLGVLLQIKG